MPLFATFYSLPVYFQTDKDIFNFIINKMPTLSESSSSNPSSDDDEAQQQKQSKGSFNKYSAASIADVSGEPKSSPPAIGFVVRDGNYQPMNDVQQHEEDEVETSQRQIMRPHSDEIRYK